MPSRLKDAMTVKSEFRKPLDHLPNKLAITSALEVILENKIAKFSKTIERGENQNVTIIYTPLCLRWLSLRLR
jgi:hypothetical protein